MSALGAGLGIARWNFDDDDVEVTSNLPVNLTVNDSFNEEVRSLRLEDLSFEAEPYQKKNRRMARRCAIVSLVIAVVAGIVLVSIHGKRQNASTTSAKKDLSRKEVLAVTLGLTPQVLTTAQSAVLDWLTFGQPSLPFWRLEQRYALAMFQYESGFVERFGWMTRTRFHECLWEGISCDNMDRVLEIKLNSEQALGVNGTLSSELQRLTVLERLLLEDHVGLVGTMNAVVLVPKLKILRITNSSLEGSIMLGDEILFVDLSRNRLEYLDTMLLPPNLTHLYLHHNPQLKGRLSALPDHLQYVWTFETSIEWQTSACRADLIDIRTNCNETCECCAKGPRCENPNK